jgi:hypothetical protein
MCPRGQGLVFWLTTSDPEHSVLSSWGFQMSSRFRAACLFALIAAAAVSILPKFDLPETAFDETDAPTVQTIITIEATSFRQYIPSRAASVLAPFARVARCHTGIISPAYTAQSSDSREFRAACILRC